MSVIGIEGNQGTMSRVLVMPIEGILIKPVGGQLNEDGFYLYRTLSTMYRVILISHNTPQRTTAWLEKEGVFRYDDILYPSNLAMNLQEGEWTNVIRILRTRGYNISMCVVNDPESALDVIEASVPALMYSQPAYGLPEWLPGSKRGAEPWDALVEKIETNRAARLVDKRMEAELD